MATITLDKTTIKAGETAVVTFTVERSHMMGVTRTQDGFRRVNDVTITGGTLTADYGFRYVEALSTATTRVYQTTFTPTPDLDRTECRISYNPSGTANDATSDIFIVDTRRPTLLSATISNPHLTTANQVSTITFTFSERITNIAIGDDLTIAEGKGRLTNLRTNDDGRTVQVDLIAPATMPANTSDKDLQVRLNMAGIEDLAGNAGSANPNAFVTYNLDNKPPSATIVVTPNPVTNSNGRLVTVTITFDEAVTGFTADNIDFSNAHVTLDGLHPIGALNRSADGRTYTITYTAAAGIEDATNTISLRNIETIRDAATNAATGHHTSGNYEIDTQAPRIYSIAFDKERLTAGDTATITVTFRESVSNFTEAAIDIPLGSVSHLTPVAGTDGTVWTATFTPTANLARASFDRFAVRLDGITDRVGNVSTGTEVRNNPTPIVIDTKVFVVNDATVNGRQLVLRYSDETALDPEQAHNAPNHAFVVLVDGVRNAVTGVAVDAAAKTVTLTLANTVLRDQQVSVA